MLSFKVTEKTLKKYGVDFKKGVLKNIDVSLTAIRRDLSIVLNDQQRKFSRSNKWQPLTPKYLERKRDEYAHRGKTGVRFVTTLKRTGKMMSGYGNGIQINPSSLLVIIPYPTDYARRHQLGQGSVPARPFDLEEFRQIVIKGFTKAING